MIEEPELSMKLKTYNVVLRINTLDELKLCSADRFEHEFSIACVVEKASTLAT